MQIPRLVIGAPASGSGKTTVTLAILDDLMQRGHKVQAFKVGPDYIDPNFHRAVTGRDSWNLDTWMAGSGDQMVRQFHQVVVGAERAVIEGVMGLFDGRRPESDEASTAEVARLLRAPVLLVVDAGAMARSAAALVQGFQRFDSRVSVAGVLLNRVGSARHYALLKTAIEDSTGIPCVGYLPRDSRLQVPERQLGLVRLQEAALESVVASIREVTRDTVDFVAMEALMANAPPLEENPMPVAQPVGLHANSKPVVALADDEAFWFYYPANLALLESLGATLRRFSPLKGEPIPADATHLYWGGGFPEEYLPQLATKGLALASYHERITAGLVTLAECGGYMALGQAIWDRAGQRFPMVGLIPFETEMTERLGGFGYRDIEVADDTEFGPAGIPVRGHEFHYSRIKGVEPRPLAYRVRGTTGEGVDGYRTRHLVAGYAHWYFPSNPAALYHWLYGGEGRD